MRTTLHKKLTLATFLFLIGFANLYAQNEPKTIHFKPSSKDSEKTDENKTPEKIFKKGESYLWLGHGLVNLDFEYYDFFGYDELESSYNIGVLFLKYEYALNKKIGLGLTANYFQNSSSTGNIYNDYISEQNYSSASILIRFNNHFYTDRNWDVYWGIGAGYKYYSRENTITEIDPIDVNTYYYYNSGQNYNMELSIGARLKVSKGVCIYSEFGATKSLFQIGMTFDLSSEN